MVVVVTLLCLFSLPLPSPLSLPPNTHICVCVLMPRCEWVALTMRSPVLVAVVVIVNGHTHDTSRHLFLYPPLSILHLTVHVYVTLIPTSYYQQRWLCMLHTKNKQERSTQKQPHTTHTQSTIFTLLYTWHGVIQIANLPFNLTLSIMA